MEYFNTDEIIGALNTFISENKSLKQKNVSSFIALLAKRSKEGLSAREVAKNIIVRQVEAGAPVGALDNGEDSISEKMEFIRVQEIIKHFIQNAKIQVVIPAGIAITGTAIGPTGAMPVKGVTSEIATGVGIIL